MNDAATVLLILAALVAEANWWAVGTGRRRLELITKPLTMVLLIALAIVIDGSAGPTRVWFVTALVFSLAGDVFLMLEPEQFIAGLASFFIAHVAYIVGLAIAGFSIAPGLIGAGVALVAVAIVGRRIFRGAASRDPGLAGPVAAYIGVISAMLVAAIASTNFVAIRGAIFFYASDAVLGWNRFVAPIKGGRVIIMASYHIAQALLVLALMSL